MIDLAQADSTLRQNNDEIKYYYVECPNGTQYGSFDSHATAIRFALKYNGKVVRDTYYDKV